MRGKAYKTPASRIGEGPLAHVNLCGNEAANEAARAATSMQTVPSIVLPSQKQAKVQARPAAVSSTEELHPQMKRYSRQASWYASNHQPLHLSWGAGPAGEQGARRRDKSCPRALAGSDDPCHSSWMWCKPLLLHADHTPQDTTLQGVRERSVWCDPPSH